MQANDRHRNWLARPVSYLRSPIKVTEQARLNDSLAFFRVCSYLGIARKSTRVKFARYIRYGFLSVRDAQDLLNGRLSREKLYLYSLAKYLIASWDLPESWFYFKKSALWHEEDEKVVSTTLFP